MLFVQLNVVFAGAQVPPIEINVEPQVDTSGIRVTGLENGALPRTFIRIEFLVLWWLPGVEFLVMSVQNSAFIHTRICSVFKESICRSNSDEWGQSFEVAHRAAIRFPSLFCSCSCFYCITVYLLTIFLSCLDIFCLIDNLQRFCMSLTFITLERSAFCPLFQSTGRYTANQIFLIPSRSEFTE